MLLLKKLSKKQIFENNFFAMRFFSILSLDLESVYNFAFFGTHIEIFEEKSFQLYFWKNIKWSILLFSMVLPRSGGGERDATFLLKCHALCPICLTFLVVHFYTHIYVSILNLWAYPWIVMTHKRES